MLTLYFHPLASYCWKVLIALYENETPFEARLVNLGDPAEAAALRALWPIGKFPVLRDDDADRTIAESSIIIEYLALHHPGRVQLLPEDPRVALDVRFRDRFFDEYVHEPMQKIVVDKLRPPQQTDALGVEQARAQLELSYSVIDRDLATRPWASGDHFTLADCAAAPALYYANRVVPLDARHPHASAYLARLLSRPSFARTLREAEPYFHLFPG